MPGLFHFLAGSLLATVARCLSWELEPLGPRVLLVVGPALQTLDRSRVDSRDANSIERRAHHRGNRWRNHHASREQRGGKNSSAKVSCRLSDGFLACDSCRGAHDRFSGHLNPNSVSSPCLQLLTASRVARNASPEEERPLAERGSAAVLAFVRRISPLVNFAPQATHGGIG